MVILFSNWNHYGDLRLNKLITQRLESWPGLPFFSSWTSLASSHLEAHVIIPLVNPILHYICLLFLLVALLLWFCVMVAVSPLQIIWSWFLFVWSALLHLHSVWSMWGLPAVECSIEEINGELWMPVVATLPTLSRQQPPMARKNGLE